MKNILLTLICLVICFGNLACSQIRSDWKPLFGEGFSEATYEKGSWEIQDNVLIAQEDKVIWAPGEHENFVLKLEFRNEVGTNSGIIVYCTDKENWVPNSVEIQIADDYCEKWGDARKDYQCGAIFGHLPASEQKVVKEPGQWNKFQITCKGQQIDVVLNGKKVTSMDMTEWTSGKTNPDGSEIPAWLPKPFGELTTRGSIGFQGKHGDAAISFRNVQIKEL